VSLLVFRIIILITGIISIMLGYSYSHELYGTTEAEVEQWGYSAQVLGFIMICLIFNAKWEFFSKLLLYLNMLIQIPPIILWFIFHGSIITDWTYSPFIAHWALSIPHILIFILCLVLLRHLNKSALTPSH